MPPTEQVLRVTRLGSGALANDVIEVFIADRDVVVRSNLPLQIVHHRPLRGIAGESSVAVTEGSVRSRLRLNGIDPRESRTRRRTVGKVRHLFHPLVPGLG